MACNETQCLPPRDVDVPGVALASKPARPARNTPRRRRTRGERREWPGISAAARRKPGPVPACRVRAACSRSSRPACFPMIPVTLAFSPSSPRDGQAAKTAARGKIVRLAAVYSLGIVLSFTAIGACLRHDRGERREPAVHEPVPEPFLAVLFVVFGLALLERLSCGCRPFCSA